MFYHHGTIRRYTAALLSMFNGLEIQYKDSNGVLHSRNIPIRYGFREKSSILSELDTKQILSGNTNVLPRATLSLSVLLKSDERTRSKYNKIGTKSNAESFDYMYNSVPYTFNFELEVLCRGMNEATMIIEQIVPKFNPIYNIDIWDADNLDEPTRVPVKLLDISIASEEYEELSTNIVTVSAGLEIKGNIYSPIQTVERIKDFKMYVNSTDGTGYFDRGSILGWDVEDDGTLTNEEIIIPQTVTEYAPQIIDILGNNIVLGSNELTLIYEDKDNKFSELTFQWDIINGDATVIENKDTGTLLINSPGVVEVQVTITDAYGNFHTLNKTFTV
jgi:hypothetical protein